MNDFEKEVPDVDCLISELFNFLEKEKCTIRLINIKLYTLMEESRWYCNRLVNEALIAVRTNCGKSVHINIPISEPLFNFTTGALPVERKIDYITTRSNITEREIEPFIKARHPLIVLGQMKHDKRLTDIIREIRKRYGTWNIYNF